MGEAKVLVGVGIATLLILGAGVFLFSRSSSTASVKADPALLLHSDSNQIATASATATLIEFGDFQCPACGSAYPYVKQILTDFSGKLNFGWRNFPLAQHRNAQIAAEAAEAAGEQGKYWAMHDLLFTRQSDWSDSDKPLDIFIEYAKSLELDPDKFSQAVTDHKFLPKIQQDTSDGNRLGVNSTPTFFVNGEKTEASLDILRAKIEAATK